MDEKLNDTTHAVSSNPEYHGSREIYAMRLTVLISQHNTPTLFKLNVTVSLCAKSICLLLPPMQETWVRSLGWEDSLEKGKATDSSILAWRIPWTV